MIEEVKHKITTNNKIGLMHDSRHDVRVISQMVSILTDKINELVRVVNEIQEKTEQNEALQN